MNREGKTPVSIRSFGRRQDMKNNRKTYLRLMTGMLIVILGTGSLLTGCKKKEEESSYYTALGVIFDLDENGNQIPYQGTSQTEYTDETVYYTAQGVMLEKEDLEITDEIPEDTTPTGSPDGGFEGTYIFYEGKRYEYAYSGFRPNLPEGFEEIGTILEVNEGELSEKDFCSIGPDMQVGMVVYGSEKYPNHLYVEYWSGDVVAYMPFYTLE